MGPPKIAFSCLISGFMVDTTIVNGGYFMVYKPTNISGGAYPVVCSQLFSTSTVVTMIGIINHSYHIVTIVTIVAIIVHHINHSCYNNHMNYIYSNDGNYKFI